MKKHFITLSFATLVVTGLIFSCKKKEETAPEDEHTHATTTGTTGSTNCTGPVCYNDGAFVSVDSANAVLYKNGVTNVRMIDIYAFKAGKQVLEFHFSPKTGAQTVQQSFAGAWLTYKTNNGTTYPNDYYNCTSGNFNLSTCDTVANHIAGTFDFVGNNGTTNKTISSGSINIHSIKKQ